LGQVGQVPLEPGKLPIEHQPRADGLAVRIEPADALRSPLPLDRAPRGALQEAGRPALGDERQVLGGGDATHRQRHETEVIDPVPWGCADKLTQVIRAGRWGQRLAPFAVVGVIFLLTRIAFLLLTVREREFVLPSVTNDVKLTYTQWYEI